MAVDRVERLLQSAAAALDAGGVPYAVIGGNAVAAWIATVDEEAVRATKDVDILLRPSDLDAAAKALHAIGLVQHDVHGITMFLPAEKPNPRSGVHIVLAGQRVREHEAHPSPDPSQAVRAKSGFWVLELRQLIVMKLQANRRVDQVHIEDMLGAGLISSEIASSLPHDLRERLEHIRTTRNAPS